MSRALVLLADGFEEVEAVTVVDVLRRGGVEVTVAAVGEGLDVAGAHGMSVRADTFLAKVALRPFDAVVLPGGAKGTENLARSELVGEVLREQQEAGRLLCAICAAPTVLCRAGVVPEDVQLTCYPGCEAGLDRPGCGAPVVADGNFITGQSPGAAMLFALVVLQSLEGGEVAEGIAHGLVTDVYP